MRSLFLLIVFSVALNAASLYSEIENIIGKNSYIANKKIIKTLFKNQRNFYTGSTLNYAMILQKLKEHHLLKLKISRSTSVSLSFATAQNHPLAFIKLIKSTLNTLGYSNINTQKVIRDRSGFMYKVSVFADRAPDPIALANELSKKDCRIVKIKRYSIANWRYLINTSHINLVPKKIAFKQKVFLPRPLEPYWINVEGARTLMINSSKRNLWHPYIVFYDQNLKILNNFIKDTKSYNVRLKIPTNAKYMKIKDIYTLENMKKGLSVYLAK